MLGVAPADLDSFLRGRRNQGNWLEAGRRLMDDSSEDDEGCEEDLYSAYGDLMLHAVRRPCLVAGSLLLTMTHITLTDVTHRHHTHIRADSHTGT